MLHTLDFKSGPDHTFYFYGRIRVMAQSMVIGLLLVLAAIAGVVSVWLLVRGSSRATAAAAKEPERVLTPAVPQPAATPATPATPRTVSVAALPEKQVVAGPQRI